MLLIIFEKTKNFPKKVSAQDACPDLRLKNHGLSIVVTGTIPVVSNRPSGVAHFENSNLRMVLISHNIVSFLDLMGTSL